MCHIICIKPYHHTVSKFHHFFLSKMFMRIHFLFLYHRTDWKSPIFTRPKNRLHVLTREWIWIYLPRPIYPGHIWLIWMIWRSLFLKFYHTHYKYMYTYIITSFWYWWKAFKFKFKIWFIWRSSPQVIDLSRLVMGCHGSPGPLAQWAERRWAELVFLVLNKYFFCLPKKTKCSYSKKNSKVFKV